MVKSTCSVSKRLLILDAHSTDSLPPAGFLQQRRPRSSSIHTPASVAVWVWDLDGSGRRADLSKGCHAAAWADPSQSESGMQSHEPHPFPWPAQHLGGHSYSVTCYIYFTVHMTKNSDQGVPHCCADRHLAPLCEIRRCPLLQGLHDCFFYWNMRGGASAAACSSTMYG